MTHKILVVEDDDGVRDLVVAGLRVIHCQALEAPTGKKAFELLKTDVPDLILLDLMLPDTDGLVIARKLQESERTRHIPIIITTARVGVANVIKGLEIGAVDYVSKPFDVMELMARVQAKLRWVKEIQPEASARAGGDFTMNASRRSLFFGGREFGDFTEKEFAVLAELLAHAPLAVSRRRIHEKVWGFPLPKKSRNIDVHINSIRQKLGPGLSHRLSSIKGRGYRFITD